MKGCMFDGRFSLFDDISEFCQQSFSLSWRGAGANLDRLYNVLTIRRTNLRVRGQKMAQLRTHFSASTSPTSTLIELHAKSQAYRGNHKAKYT